MSRKRKRNRINATGRNATSRFVRLDYRLLNSKAYRALSPNARSLLVELGMLFNNKNNGSLYLSIRDGAARLGVVDLKAAMNAFDELEELGLIEKTRDAYFRIKAAEGSRARCWRLAWLPGPGKKLPDFSFYDREPAPKTRARARMEMGLRALSTYRKARDANQLPVLDIETLNAADCIRAGAPVRDSLSLDQLNQGIRATPPDRDSRTHIAITMGDATSIKVGPRLHWSNPMAMVERLSREIPRGHWTLTLPTSSNLGWQPNFGPRNLPFERRIANDN